MEKNSSNSKKKKKTQYKTSRVLIVVVAALIGLFLIYSGGKFVFNLMTNDSAPVDVETNFSEEIETAKALIGEDIIYVESSFEDDEGEKYKGMTFLSEEELLFISDDFQKRFDRDFIQEISVTTGSDVHEFAVIDEDGKIYNFGKIEINENSEGFMAILTR